MFALPSSFVALDIETTGLDPDSDSVTEVGLVRFDAEGNELEVFETVVDPGREIPLFVQNLTGISNEDVVGAPTLGAIAGRIRDFAGGDPIVGHNIAFDRGYLQRAGADPAGPSVDTGELARILLPGRRSLGLTELARELGLEPSLHHRALADARTAAGLFVALRRRASELPQDRRAHLARLAASRDVLLAQALDLPEEDGYELPSLSLQPAGSYPRLERLPGVEASLEEAVAKAFAAAPRAFAGWDARPQQVDMANAVAGAIDDGGSLLVEAGTGVGKSLAYLVPAAIYALREGRRIVVSTNTIGLQEQVLRKDIPALRVILREAGMIRRDDDLRAVLLKGRGNYLCLQRWMASMAASTPDPDITRLAAATLLWLPNTTTGDRAELNLDQTDWVTWNRVSAQDADCLSRQNAWVREGTCFLQRSRLAAESAHIVVVNHSLLLADTASGGNAIPDHDILVLDEAHNLEETATRQFGLSLSRRNVADALDACYRPGGRERRAGGIAEFLRAFPGKKFEREADALQAAAQHANDVLVPYLAALELHLAPGGDARLRINGAVRSSPDWGPVEERADALAAALSAVSRVAGEAGRAVTAAEGADALGSEVESAARRVDDVRARLEALLGPPREGTVTWAERDREGAVMLQSAPLDVGDLLREQVFEQTGTVIATSATLFAGREDRYVAGRLGLDEAQTVRLGSPFDYKRSTLLASAVDIPEPSDPSYPWAIARAVEELVTASGGRALVLFTSHASLAAVAERVRAPLEEAGIAVLAQGVDGTPARLVQSLAAQPRSVILGTSTFWEGVDIRGEALSLLVICRLPFAVPTDPVHQARSELFQRPFDEYSLPSAVLRFRQGFGRLIRSREDRGVAVVLDARVRTRRYGRTFIDALPPCTYYQGPVRALGDRVREWLDR